MQGSGEIQDARKSQAHPILQSNDGLDGQATSHRRLLPQAMCPQRRRAWSMEQAPLAMQVLLHVLDFWPKTPGAHLRRRAEAAALRHIISAVLFRTVKKGWRLGGIGAIPFRESMQLRNPM